MAVAREKGARELALTEGAREAARARARSTAEPRLKPGLAGRGFMASQASERLASAHGEGGKLCGGVA